MTPVELRLLRIRVNKSRHEAPTISNRQLKRRRCRSLVMPSAVIRVPDKNARNTGVHSRGHQKRHPVLDFWMSDVDVGDDSIADDGGDEDEEHDDPAQLEAIRYNGDNDCYHGGDGVWDHGPELGFVGCVAELDDDGGEEEAEGVQAR